MPATTLTKSNNPLIGKKQRNTKLSAPMLPRYRAVSQVAQPSPQELRETWSDAS